MILLERHAVVYAGQQRAISMVPLARAAHPPACSATLTLLDATLFGGDYRARAPRLARSLPQRPRAGDPPVKVLFVHLLLPA